MWLCQAKMTPRIRRVLDPDDCGWQGHASVLWDALMCCPAGPSHNSLSTEATMADAKSLSGLTEQQAKEFHEQFKITYTAFMGLAALAHLFVIANNPWW